ncbi:MAG: thiol:disulfide interchange protein DsbA/DsbL [Deltaproteobacteria bacterium]|nr:thiol:disulfide interchange protein DsbA/DsbL [Deltaproteobacteria bacterium]
MKRLTFLLVFLATIIFLGQVLAAQDSKTSPTPEVLNYGRIQKIKSPKPWDGSSKKVELIYFFWYGCPTCKAIDEKVSVMAAFLPEGITFKKLPAAFRENQEWTAHAKLFWALESLGLERRLHSKIFSAVSPGGGHGPVQLVSPASQEAFAMANQIPAKDFTAALESPLVRNMLAKTDDYLGHIELNSVPAFIVNDELLVTIDSRYNVDIFLSVVSQLAVDALNAQKAASPEAPASGPPAPASSAAPAAEPPAPASPAAEPPAGR